MAGGADIETLRRSYVYGLLHAQQDALAHLQELVGQWTGTGTRFDRDANNYRKFLSDCAVALPFTYAEYKEALKTDEYVAGTFLIATDEEARSLLERGPLRIPTLIPAALATTQRRRSRTTIAQYLDRLEAFDKVSVHDFAAAKRRGRGRGRDGDGEGEHIDYATQMPSGEVRRRFESGTANLNLLDLHGTQPNPAPEYMVDIPEYTILAELKETNTCGKPTKMSPRDLTACSTFTVLGGKGVFSWEHIDHCGVVTVLEVVEGDKLWPTWPALTDTDFERWAFTSEVPGQPFLIRIGPGDVLLQPSGTAHAPYSVRDTLIHGTMWWNSKDMARTAFLTFVERWRPDITNEEASVECKKKMARALKLWERRSRAFPWGTEEELQTFKSHIDNASKKKVIRCDCGSTCMTDGCKCRLSGVKCTIRCHVTAEGTYCRNCVHYDEDNKRIDDDDWL